MVERYTPEYAAPLTGISAEQIRWLARLYAGSPRAMLCWTLGITEHHNATDNVYAPRPGKHQTAMIHVMEHGELRSLYVIGENPVQSDADQHRVQGLFEGLDFVVVQDITMTATARLADVVLPGCAG